MYALQHVVMTYVTSNELTIQHSMILRKAGFANQPTSNLPANVSQPPSQQPNNQPSVNQSFSHPPGN
jgi:hypothetical protein